MPGDAPVSVSTIRRLRPILPATAATDTPTASTTPTTRETHSSTRAVLPAGTSAARQKPQIRAACEACRKRKTGCNALRPRCAYCAKCNIPCVYITAATDETHTQALKRKYDELRETKTSSDRSSFKPDHKPEAQEIVRRSRAGADAGSLLRFVESGDLLLQINLTPQTYRRRYEFPYMLDMPIHLYGRKNPYLQSLLHRATFSEQSQSQALTDDSNGTREEHAVNVHVPPSDLPDLCKRQCVNKIQRARDTTSHHITCSLPYHAASMVEPLVEKATAVRWTHVITDNRLFRRLIYHYFFYPHPCGPFVHKDLFLEDMVTGRTDFCSPLLVNAMLATASQSCTDLQYRSRVWLPASLTYRFLAEARRLWDVVSFEKSQITTIQAALLLSSITAHNGMDNIGFTYINRACEMCTDLGVFGPDNDEESPKMEKARIFTAWATFSWQAMSTFFYFRAPFMEQHPYIPLPDAQVQPQWYGEIWIQYPCDRTMYPLQLGHKLQAEVALRIIMNKMGWLAFGRPPGLLALDEVVTLIQSLDVWKQSLPQALQAERLVLPSHLMLHVQYHQIIITLMQLIIDSVYVDHTEISRLLAMKTPYMVLEEAKIMLETVMRLYYSRHGFDFQDSWVTFASAAIGNAIHADLAMVEVKSNPDLLNGYRSTLILCVQGLNRQGLNFHNSMLAAIQLEGAVNPEDLQLVQSHATFARISKEEKALIAEHAHCMWPIPGIAGINTDPDKIRLGNLINVSSDSQL